LKAAPFSIETGVPRIGDFDVTRLKRLSLVLLAATLLPAGAALARVDQPAQNAAPGTGSVVHLFGPQSVFNKIGNIVPEQNQAAPAADASTATPTSTSTAPVATNSATETPASSDTGSAGGLLHQMFVTGDGTPTSARLSQGRPGAR
jgi:hypothetical protein